MSLVIDDKYKITVKGASISSDAWAMCDLLLTKGITGFYRVNTGPRFPRSSRTEEHYDSRYFGHMEVNGYPLIYPKSEHEFKEEFLKLFELDLTLDGNIIMCPNTVRVTILAAKLSGMLYQAGNTPIEIDIDGGHKYNDSYFEIVSNELVILERYKPLKDLLLSNKGTL